FFFRGGLSSATIFLCLVIVTVSPSASQLSIRGKVVRNWRTVAVFMCESYLIHKKSQIRWKRALLNRWPQELRSRDCIDICSGGRMIRHAELRCLAARDRAFRRGGH